MYIYIICIYTINVYIYNTLKVKMTSSPFKLGPQVDSNKCHLGPDCVDQTGP